MKKVTQKFHYLMRILMHYRQSSWYFLSYSMQLLFPARSSEPWNVTISNNVFLDQLVS